MNREEQLQDYKQNNQDFNQQSPKSSREFGKHREQLKEKAATLTHDFKELGTAAKSIAQDTVGMLSENTGNYLLKGREGFKSAEKKMESVIGEHPLYTLAIATGIGLLLGMMWKKS